MPHDAQFANLHSRLAADTDSAAEDVFRRYAAELVRLAEAEIASSLRPKFDGEDVVQSALRSFFQRRREGQFELTSWDGLWGLLVRITLRKCGRTTACWQAAKRDARRETTLEAAAEQSSRQAWQAREPEPSAEEAAMLSETLQEVLSGLTDRQRTVLLMDLQGHTAREIAGHVERSVRMVRRTLRLIREALERHTE